MMKGPGIFLAQFMADTAPFNRFDTACRWAAGLDYTGVQVPSWDARCIDLKKAGTSKGYCDELRGTAAAAGVEI
ncbi:MAG TPA: sugar phosphate isomerase/epimerase, partial [Planctomycetota bacterium]|nr:sugar phosphate isomerase/epimerase [Planctomycetota bacterium]